VIHRDIKPENILLHDGQALIADFGIALAANSAGAARLTETGISLGTPQYMSPEQAMGERELDARTDVYALGCVLYEMLVGEPPFTGPTAQAIMGKVLSAEPASLTSQRRTVPPDVEVAVLTALQKLPADRFGSAGEFAAALGAQAPAMRPATSPHVQRSARRVLRDRELVGWIAAAALGAALLAPMVSTRNETGTAEPVRRLHILLPDSAPLAFVGEAPLRVGRTSLALSPDGQTLVYVGRTGNTTRLFARPLEENRVTALPDTDGVRAPFFSPDGEVSASGGKADRFRPVLRTAEPSFLPDGQWVIARSQLSSLETNEVRVLTTSGLSAESMAFREARQIGSIQYLQWTPRVGGRRPSVRRTLRGF
jgi:serine/threonine-protein kinase